MAIFLLSFLCVYRRRLKLIGLFLDYATHFLSSNCIVFVYIPVFIILTIGLIVLCTFQHLAFASHYEPIPVDNDVYLRSDPITVLEILNIIEFIWGLQFLKDTCKIY